MKKKLSAYLGAFLLLTYIFSFCAPVYCAASERGESEASISAGIRQDTEVSSRFWELLFGKKKTESAIEKNTAKKELTLCPGGDVFGVKIAKESVSVASADEECILKCGDVIISVDGKRIKSLSDVKKILESTDGKTLDLVIERGGERFEAEITPKKTDSGYKLGAVLKDGVAGIGTVTYFNPETCEFGGLGHGICDGKSGEIVKMRRGNVTGVILGGVDKSEGGNPGELTGILTEETIGELYANTEEGVFGKLNTPPDLSRAALPVGDKSDVVAGEASIYSTIKNGHRDEYKIEIFDVDYTSTGSKSFKVRVTDDTLKALTGGIVRGMSGSPIIQNGKLVGAVTHVMMSEPTVGYGIFIENMLSAAENTVPKAA